MPPLFPADPGAQLDAALCLHLFEFKKNTKKKTNRSWAFTLRELEAAAVGMDKNLKALPTVLYQCPQTAQLERAKTLSDSACRPRPAMQPGHGGHLLSVIEHQFTSRSDLFALPLAPLLPS